MPTGEVIEFSGTISQDMFRHAYRLHFKRRRGPLIVVAFGLILLILISVISGDNDSAMILAAFGTGGVLIGIVAMRRKVNREFNKSPYIRAPRRGTVTREKLHLETSLGHSDLPWSMFIGIQADDDLVLLYLGPNAFQMVAKEFFTSQDDWEEARTIALECVPR